MPYHHAPSLVRPRPPVTNEDLAHRLDRVELAIFDEKDQSRLDEILKILYALKLFAKISTWGVGLAAGTVPIVVFVLSRIH